MPLSRRAKERLLLLFIFELMEGELPYSVSILVRFLHEGFSEMWEVFLFDMVSSKSST